MPKKLKIMKPATEDEGNGVEALDSNDGSTKDGTPSATAGGAPKIPSEAKNEKVGKPENDNADMQPPPTLPNEPSDKPLSGKSVKSPTKLATTSVAERRKINAKYKLPRRQHQQNEQRNVDVEIPNDESSSNTSEKIPAKEKKNNSASSESKKGDDESSKNKPNVTAALGINDDETNKLDQAYKEIIGAPCKELKNSTMQSESNDDVHEMLKNKSIFTRPVVINEDEANKLDQAYKEILKNQLAKASSDSKNDDKSNANNSDNETFRMHEKTASATADTPSKPTAPSPSMKTLPDFILNKNEDHSNLTNSFKKALFSNPSPSLAAAYEQREFAVKKRNALRRKKMEALRETQQVRDEILKLREKFRKKKEKLLRMNSLMKESSREVGGWTNRVFQLELEEPCAWNTKLESLRDYVQANGSPPAATTKDIVDKKEKKLSIFIMGMKKKAQNNHKSIRKFPHRKLALEKLGVNLIDNDIEREKHFEVMLKKLAAYKREHGTFRMPSYEQCRASENDELLLLHNWVFSEVTLSNPEHTKRMKDIGFSFDKWCGTKPCTNLKDATKNGSGSKGKHNGVRDMVRLAILSFLSARHKNGRIKHGAIAEAERKFGYSRAGIRNIWRTHGGSVLEPSLGLDVRSKHPGRKSKYDTNQIREMIEKMPPGKRMSIRALAVACNVPSKSSMHRLLHQDPILAELAMKAGLFMASKPKSRLSGIMEKKDGSLGKRKDPPPQEGSDSSSSASSSDEGSESEKDD